jgi:3-hydroxyacyl-CoA dehydrogenase/enoyl-CoA hydratase/3-hydroxybutyryl-CoA epimerase
MTVRMSNAPLPIELAGRGDRGTVAVVRLEQPGRPVVVLDADLIARLDATLDTLPRSIAGLVLASNADRAFVAGADLKAIMALDDAGLHSYLERAASVFQRLADLPCPTAAAIHGATLGGGFELAAHCDGLIACPAAKPYPVGLPEAGLKICPGWGGTVLLPARIDPGVALRQTAAGRTMTFDQARELALFDAVAESREALVPAAVSWVLAQPAPVRDGAPSRWAGAPRCRDAVDAALREAETELSATGPGRAVLDCVRIGLDQGWPAACRAERGHLVSLRNTADAKAAISAFFEKSSPKPNTSPNT